MIPPGEAIALRKQSDADPFTIDASGKLRTTPDVGWKTIIIPGIAIGAFLLYPVFLVGAIFLISFLTHHHGITMR